MKTRLIAALRNRIHFSRSRNVMHLLIAGLMICTTAAFAQKGDTTSRHMHNRSGHGDRGFYGIPDLTADQKKKIEALRTPLAKEILPITNQLGEKRAHLRTLQTADKADQTAINSTIDEISQLQSQLMKKHAAQRQAIRKILTDDQRVAFDLHAGHEGKFGKFGHGKDKGHHRGNGERMKYKG